MRCQCDLSTPTWTTLFLAMPVSCLRQAARPSVSMAIRSARLLDAGSPYERVTYRYSPVFAFMLLPDALLGSHSIGKLFFSAFDIALGATMARLGLSRGLGEDAHLVAVAWLANPIAIGICTRGSSDAIVAAMVAIAIDLADSKLPIMAGAVLGVAAHVKLYPIIHLPAFVVHFVSAETNGFSKACTCAASAVAAFLVTSVAACCAYNEYLDEALLYHIRRVDHRHNFSPFWFPIYLALHASVRRNVIGLAPFVLHAASQAATIACLARRDVVVCVFAQTLLFVAANKVSTAQYIVWWLPFALLAAAPVARYAPRRLLAATLLWLLL